MTFMPRCARRSAWRWHTVSPGEAGVALRYWRSRPAHRRPCAVPLGGRGARARPERGSEKQDLPGIVGLSRCIRLDQVSSACHGLEKRVHTAD